MVVDEKEFELLERRLAESVENRVRGRIFGVYGTIAAGILAAFTYFGYDIVSSIKPSVTKAASEASLKEIQPILEEVETAAEDAKRLAIRSAADLDAMETFRRNAQLRLNNTLNKVNEVTANIESALQEIRDKLDSAEKDVDTYRQRSTDLFLSVGYEEIIQDLASNVDKLTSAVASLKTETSPDALQDIDVLQSKSTLEAVLERSTNQQSDAKTTVYFQFAGVTRELAEEISGKLNHDEFTIPGEERVAAAANKSEVRYFYREDRDQAKLFAETVNSVLGSMELKENVSARFLQLAKSSPRRGVLELWLEPKLR